MYAILDLGYGQCKAVKDETITVQKIEKKEGEAITFDKVILLSEDDFISIGQPYVKDAEVRCQVLRHFKTPKQIAYKYKRRKDSHKKIGHRQQLTSLLVKEIAKK